MLRVGVTPCLGLSLAFWGQHQGGHKSHADLRSICEMAVWVAQSRAAAGIWEQLGSVCSRLKGQAVSSCSGALQRSILAARVCPCHQQEKLLVPSCGFPALSHSVVPGWAHGKCLSTRSHYSNGSHSFVAFLLKSHLSSLGVPLSCVRAQECFQDFRESRDSSNCR